MPVQYFENPTRALTYEELTGWAVDVAQQNNNNIIEYLSYVNQQYPDADLTDFMLEQTDKYLDYFKTADGKYQVLGYRTEYQSTSVPNPINSNSTQIGRGSFRQVLNNGVQTVGDTVKRHITPYPASGGLGARASYVLGSVGGALGAVSTGITLGKVIAPALYDAAPNFWQSIGVSEGSFEPSSWASLTNESDSPFAGLFNMILGIDPDTGKSQMYMDENALAYFAMAMAQNGVFSQPSYTVETNPDETVFTNVNIPLYVGNGYCSWTWTQSGHIRQNVYVDETDPNAKWLMFLSENVNEKNRTYVCISEIYGTHQHVEYTYVDGVLTNTRRYTSSLTYNSVRYDDKLVYYVTNSNGDWRTITGTYPQPSGAWNDQKNMGQQAWLAYYGYVESGGIDGISNQPDATLPDVSTWDTLPNTINSLQNQYPDLFSNPLVWDNWQPDGTLNQSRYVPVGMPQTLSNNYAQPTTGTQTQANTQIDTNSLPADLLQTLTNILTAPQTQTQPEPYIPPANPIDTGTGTTPTPLPPTGNASALWSVYHPTQAQVDSFGAWLWTGDIITQIQQLLQNPMEGIITLHKVFANPVDSGNGTIVVGRLDSNVPSATVTQQYVTVDCGSIDCYEEFGNIFDYSPYTDVALYLPFIGIVPLNVSDVMRSTIHVTYGVDVFTGACLAMVEVSRDGNTINLYQYAGMASVEYPLTGSVHSGLITGLLGVAGSIAATVATGGVGAPAAIAAVGGLASAGTSHNARAGGFSGNAGAMGIKTPYLIIERPQTKIAETFHELAGYPTNYSCKLNDCSGHVVVKHVHIEGINATDSELDKINNLLMSGVIV